MVGISVERDRVNGFGGLEDGLRQASPWYLWGPYALCSMVATANAAVSWSVPTPTQPVLVVMS